MQASVPMYTTQDRHIDHRFPADRGRAATPNPYIVGGFPRAYPQANPQSPAAWGDNRIGAIGNSAHILVQPAAP